MSSTTITMQLMSAARRNPLAAIALVLIAGFTLMALLAPLLAPHDPAALSLSTRLTPPHSAHWFGTDELGRDILSRIIYGSRISMLVGVSVVALSLSIGMALGSVAGYYGGILDRLLNLVVINTFQSFPGILLAIAFVAFLGPGLFNLILALVLGGWVGYARLVRAQVMAAREREYVTASRALGASDARILMRHIIPNIIQPVIVQAAIGMAG